MADLANVKPESADIDDRPERDGFSLAGPVVGSKILIQLGVHPWCLLAMHVGILGGIGLLFIVKRHRGTRSHLRTISASSASGCSPYGLFNGFAILAREDPPAEWVVE